MAPSRPQTPTTPRSGVSSRASSPSSTVANSPTRYLPPPKSPSKVTKQQKRMPRTFPQFSKLPLELQDSIWEQALGMDVPNAHGVYLREVEGVKPDDHLGAQIADGVLWHSPAGLVNDPIYPIKTALQLTCTRSQNTVDRSMRVWKPLEEHQIYGGFGTRPGQTDQSRDLYLLSGEWRREVTPEAAIPGVRYVGITWEGSWDNQQLGPRIDKIAKQFVDVQCVYILVPSHLTVFPHLKQWKEADKSALDDYVDACNATAEGPAGTQFRARNVLYEEIPYQELQNMEALREAIEGIGAYRKDIQARRKAAEEARKARDKAIEAGEIPEEETEIEENIPEPAVRLMTWAPSPRVRGRFG